MFMYGKVKKVHFKVKEIEFMHNIKIYLVGFTLTFSVTSSKVFMNSRQYN